MTESPVHDPPTLHVLDAHRAPWGILHAIACLSQCGTHRVLVLGNTRDARRARDAGIRGAARIQPPRNDPARAARTIRRALRRGHAFDRVLAWDERVGRTLGNLATGTVREPPRSIEAAYPTRALDRRALRRQWSVGGRTLVIIPADDHPSRVDAMRLCYIAGVLSVAGRDAIAIAPSSASNLDRAARFAWRHGRARWLVIDDRPPLLLRAAADAAWWGASQTPDTGLTLRMLLRAGLPAAADRAEQTVGVRSAILRLCEPANELSPVTALLEQPNRTDAEPDHGAFRRDVQSRGPGSLSLDAVGP